MATSIPSNNVAFRIEELCQACGATVLSGPNEGRINGISTDSRTIQPGNLFVALIGEHHNGHAYLKAAAKAGASALLISEDVKVPKDITVLHVDDTLKALGDLARVHRRRWGGYVVAVSGSAGKTMTKDFAAAVLTGLYKKVLKTEGNLNNRIGLPMTLFQLSAEHQLAVVELGISTSGEMDRLADMAQPDAAIITNVAAAHTEGFGDEKQIAFEKGALLRALSSKGLAIVNDDNPFTDTLLEEVGASRIVRFGVQQSADIQLRSQELTASLTNELVVGIAENNHELRMTLKQLGAGAAMNATAVIALVHSMVKATDPKALPKALDRAARILGEVSPAQQRFRLWRGPARSLVIDDTYNASPASMQLALDTASDIARTVQGRLLLILGDMKELGERSRKEHQIVGRQVIAVSAALFVGVGDEMKAAVESGSETTGLAAPTPAISVAQAQDAVQPVLDMIQERDVVLIKGSRSMKMEYAVHGLLNAEQKK